MLQNAISLSREISALTSEHLWCTCLLHWACHAKCIFAALLQRSHACHPFFNWNEALTFYLLLARCRIYCACHQERRLSVQKWLDLVCFTILTSKCASRHNGEHFFDSSTSKSAPTLRFSFRNVLRAIIACTFSTAQLPKVFRHWETRFAPQSRHFCTSQLPKLLRAWAATCLRTRRFSEPTFRPSGATEHCKTTVLGNLAPFREFWSSFYWPSLFWLFLFSDCSRHCCCTCP